MDRRGVLRCIALTVVLCASLLVSLANPVRAQTAIQTVRLVIDYGDGSLKLYTDIPWSSRMTILDVMNSARTHPHGISFTYRGSAEAALLTAIDGVGNQ